MPWTGLRSHSQWQDWLEELSADDARKILEKHRWPDGPICPHCQAKNHCHAIRKKRKGTKDEAKPRRYRCRGCGRAFSVMTGTIMEASHIPLNKWLHAFYLFASSKESVSQSGLKRELRLQKGEQRLHRSIDECMRKAKLPPARKIRSRRKGEAVVTAQNIEDLLPWYNAKQAPRSENPRSSATKPDVIDEKYGRELHEMIRKKQAQADDSEQT